MRFLRRASSFLNNIKSSKFGSNLISSISGFLSKISLLHIGLFSIPAIIILVVSLTLMSLFNYKINLMQMVDDGGDKTAFNVCSLTYDATSLEEYYDLSQKAYESPNRPSSDLSSSEYSSVSGFNKHIKDNVCMAGYGTRQGVVAAGMSLIGDYIKSTGKRVRYDQYSLGGRQDSDTEGIVNDDFYLDCSGFSWWALYNGGFKLPSYAQTQSIYDWAASYGGIIKNDITKGQAGDFLDKADSHIMLIVGTYSGGYYVAEEAGWRVGGVISKISYSNLSEYSLLDMTKYYNDQSHVRTSSYTCPKCDSGNFPNESSKLAYQRIRNVESSTGILIAVDYDRSYVHVFAGSAGDWKLVRSFPAITGRNRYFGKGIDRNGVNTTPIGLFRTSGGVDVVSTQHPQYTLTYTVRINSNDKGGAAWFHGLVKGYISKSTNPDTQHDLMPKFIKNSDKRASGGCVMLINEDAKWLFNTVKNGTSCYIWTEKPATNKDGFENKKLKKIMVGKGYNDVSKLTADDRLYVYGSSGPLPYPVVSY